MLKSQEILDSIKQMQQEVVNFQKEGKTDDALTKLNEIEDKKKEYEVAKKVEDMEKEDLENKGEGDFINELPKEKVAFVNMVRTGQITNAFSQGDQGAIIPTTVATDIIDAVKEKLDIVGESSKFAVKGKLSFPKYGKDETNTGIVASYAADFTELTATSGKFTNVELNGHLIGALAKIGKQLIANTNVAVYNFIVDKVSQAISDFIESEMTKGSTKIKGYETTNNTIEMEGSTIKSDDLINMQMAIKTKFQANAKWRMNTETFKTVRKLKDQNGQYLLNKDIINGFGMVLLGKPVEIEENAESVCYGDFSGYYTNMPESLEVQILLEKYATEHAIGVVAYAEIDGAPVDEQKYVKLVAKSA